MNPPVYLSIVAAARNDNYGGDFNLRFQNCISWFDYYANKYHLHCEFVIVNYNELTDHRALKDMINTAKGSVVTYRFINVPATFHQELLAEKKRLPLPFFEYVAKNIGVRRAEGEFILCINPDVLLDPSIIKQLSKKKLRKGSYYRADRCDTYYNEAITDPEMNLNEIKAEVFRIFKKGVTYNLEKKGINFKVLCLFEIKNYFYLKWNLFVYRIKWLANFYPINIIYDNIVFRFHSNHGDFLLMHREYWHKIKGHPENNYHPLNTDALTVAAAYSSGLSEKIFFQPIYHADHERRFVSDKSTPELASMFKSFIQAAKQMLEQKAPLTNNNLSWGFAGVKFDEIILKNK